MVDLNDMQRQAMSVRKRYAEFEHSRYGRSWTREELVLGFVGDVGDLAKLVAAAEGVRAIPDLQARLAHELADCLWSVLVLADAYGVNLEAAFADTMDESQARLG